MTKLRRDDTGPRHERTAEDRERDRREREARRAGGDAGSLDTPPAPPIPVSEPPSGKIPDAEPPPAPIAHREPPPPALPPPALPPPAPPAPATPIPAAEPPPAPVPDPEPPPPALPPPAPAPPLDPPTEVAQPAPPPAEPQHPIRRIQPDPPAPPAAPAGALGDETERPSGVRWARNLAHRRPRVTPPADVPRGPVRARRSIGKRLLALIVLLVAAALVYAVITFFQPFHATAGAPVRVEIPSGAGAGDVGERLAAAGVVDSGTIFSLRATLAGKRGGLRSGSYALERNMTYGAVIDALSAAPAAAAKAGTITVTIPEGRSRREITSIAKDAGVEGDYLQASRRFAGALSPYRYRAPKRTRKLEGFLFPDTYELKRGATARQLVEKQLGIFREKFATVDLRYARRKKLTAYDVLIIASMVEREARIPRERKLIAAVIYNRLQDGTPLGIDATVRYIFDKPSGALTRSELASDSPYNTRKRANLPPTPIGNPGLASIVAAANPARVGSRYFVVKPGSCGEHAFASSLAQHERNVARYTAAREKAGGKSPTTC